MDEAIEGTWKGMDFGFGSGFIWGAGNQMYSNWANNTHLLLGKTQLSRSIEKTARDANIYSGNKDPLDPKIVDSYYKQMENKTFDSNHGIGGFRDEKNLLLEKEIIEWQLL